MFNYKKTWLPYVIIFDSQLYNLLYTVYVVQGCNRFCYKWAVRVAEWLIPSVVGHIVQFAVYRVDFEKEIQIRTRLLKAVLMTLPAQMAVLLLSRNKEQR